jgi:hypothetical protein
MSMKSFLISAKKTTLILTLSIFVALSAVAQNDPQVALAKKQNELDRQRIELEKRNLELQRKEI